MNNSTNTNSTSTTTKMSAWINPRRKRFWLIVLLVIYTFGGFFLAPWLMERVATQKVSEVNRTLTFGDIKVNPFLLTVLFLDTRLTDSDGQLLFSYDDYFLDLQTSSLFRWAWTFKEIRLSGLQLNWEQFAPGDNRFGRLIDAFPTEEEPANEISSQGLPRLVIHKLQINQAAASLIDHLEQGNFETQLGPIDVQITGLSTLPDESGQQQVNITTRAGGKIAWQGSLQLSPLLSSGKLSVNGRVLKDFNHYVTLITPMVIEGEGLDIAFSYEVKQAAGDEIAVALDDLNMGIQNWNFSLPEEPEPLLVVPEMRIEGGSLRWPAQTLDINRITVTEPTLGLIQEANGALNLDRIFPATENSAAEAAPATPATESGSDDWQLNITRFEVNSATAKVTDQTTQPSKELTLENASLVLEEVSNQVEASIPLQADFSLASGGSGRFDGQLVALPDVSLDGRFSLDSVALVVAQPWVNELALLNLNSGELSLDGEVSMSPQQAGKFTGSVAITGLDITENLHNEKLAGWKQLDIDTVELDLAAGTVKTGVLEFNQPFGRLQIEADKTTNLDGLMIESASADAEESALEPAEELAITVAGIEIKDANLDFSDLTLPLPFSTTIKSMDGTISTLATSSQEPARVDMEGQVNEYGLARINGSINAWSPVDFTDIQMTFRNLEMERITPYTIEFAGWEIASGRMDLDLDYKIKDGQLNGANAVVIKELTVGDKVENSEGTSLPLKLAVALLKDSDGVIDVDLPVTGDLNDPKFRIGGIVLKAIGNLLVKAVTAPFRLLGALVGIDSEDFGVLHFSPGKAEISPPDQEQLFKLAEAMRQRPELQLDVAGPYTVELDTIALKTQKLDARIEAAMDALNTESGELPTDQRLQVSEQLAVANLPGVDLELLKQEFMQVPEGEDPERATAMLDEPAYVESLRQRLIEAEPVGQADLLALAQARADAVLAVFSSDAATTPALAVLRSEPVAAEASDSSEVPLELKVEATN